MNILIVEDEQAIASIYKKILESNGETTQIASKPNEAISVAGTLQFDFAFIDLMLPEMNGTELIKRLRTIKNFNKTPVVVTTNMGSGFDEDVLTELGVKEILLKVKAGPAEILECVSKYT